MSVKLAQIQVHLSIHAETHQHASLLQAWKRSLDVFFTDKENLEENTDASVSHTHESCPYQRKYVATQRELVDKLHILDASTSLSYVTPSDLDSFSFFLLHDAHQERLSDSMLSILHLLKQLQSSSLTFIGPANQQLACHACTLPHCPTHLITNDSHVAQHIRYAFRDVASPSPSDFPSPDGLRIPLYRYQCHSVHRMIQREQPPPLVDAAIYIQCIQPLTHYVHLPTGHLTHHPTHHPDDQGGILCEDMGTGKTAICFALLLAQRGILSAPPPATRLYDQNADVSSRTFPSLRRLATRAVARLPSTECQRFFSASSARTFELLLPAPYFLRTVLPEKHARTPAKTIPVTLSRATLLIVPLTLFDQWLSQLQKHCFDHALSLLPVRDTTALPSPTQLAAYDVLLITHARLAQEASTGNIQYHALQRASVCRCAYQGNSRVILCHCQTETVPEKKPLIVDPTVASLDRRTAVPDHVRDALYLDSTTAHPFSSSSMLSPLLRVHWKRLIVDEGHVMGHRETRQTQFARALSSECRWICSGTPFSYRSPQADMDKVLAMLAFLQGSTRPPLSAAEKRELRTRFHTLQATFQRLMVRHAPESIALDVLLPPCRVRTVVLPLNEEERRRYNARVAAIRTNLILSEGEGLDSYWHPTNHKHAWQAIDSLIASCVHLRALSRAYQQDCIEHILAWFLQRPALFKFQEENVSASTEDMAGFHAYLARDGRADLLRCLRYVRMQLESKAHDADGHSYWLRHVDPALLYDTMQWTPRDVFYARGVANVGIHELDELVDVYQGLMRVGAWEERQTALLETITLAGTSSAKLNHLMRSMVGHVAQEKTIVFSRANHVINCVSECLDLLGIEALRFDQSTRPAQRAHYVTTFNTTQRIRVMIMNTDLAAYGIDLTAATRVYFMEPVWEPSQEMQAIKRAHRIGQTRPVLVEILLAEGSLEEPLWRARETVERAAPSKLRTILSQLAFIEKPGDAAYAIDQDAVLGAYQLNRELLSKTASRGALLSMILGCKDKTPSGEMDQQQGDTADDDEDEIPAFVWENEGIPWLNREWALPEEEKQQPSTAIVQWTPSEVIAKVVSERHRKRQVIEEAQRAAEAKRKRARGSRESQSKTAKQEAIERNRLLTLEYVAKDRT